MSVIRKELTSNRTFVHTSRYIGDKYRPLYPFSSILEDKGSMG
jgi:hypothetical protein